MPPPYAAALGVPRAPKPRDNHSTARRCPIASDAPCWTPTRRRALGETVDDTDGKAVGRSAQSARVDRIARGREAGRRRNRRRPAHRRARGVCFGGGAVSGGRWSEAWSRGATRSGGGCTEGKLQGPERGRGDGTRCQRLGAWRAAGGRIRNMARCCMGWRGAGGRHPAGRVLHANESVRRVGSLGTPSCCVLTVREVLERVYSDQCTDYMYCTVHISPVRCR